MLRGVRFDFWLTDLTSFFFTVRFKVSNSGISLRASLENNHRSYQLSCQKFLSYYEPTSLSCKSSFLRKSRVCGILFGLTFNIHVTWENIILCYSCIQNTICLMYMSDLHAQLLRQWVILHQGDILLHLAHNLCHMMFL